MIWSAPLQHVWKMYKDQISVSITNSIFLCEKLIGMSCIFDPEHITVCHSYRGSMLVYHFMKRWWQICPSLHIVQWPDKGPVKNCVSYYCWGHDIQNTTIYEFLCFTEKSNSRVYKQIMVVKYPSKCMARRVFSVGCYCLSYASS